MILIRFLRIMIGSAIIGFAIVCLRCGIEGVILAIFLVVLGWVLIPKKPKRVEVENGQR